MSARGLAGDRTPIVVGWVLGLACFVYLLALPPTLNIADESFILYGAKRVYQGQALYHDFFDFLTPGSFYLYALAYAVGGVPFVLVVLAGMVYRLRTALVLSEHPAARALVRIGWAVVLAIVLVKGWANAQLAWTEYPVLYDTAFGTLAGNAVHAGAIRDLRNELQVDPAKPPRLFAHPTDAWIYLALPADNPTPYALLRPVYNTPEQIADAIERIERDPEAVVLLNIVSVTPDDPLLAELRLFWHEAAGIGPPIIVGTPLYRLYRRGSSG